MKKKNIKNEVFQKEQPVNNNPLLLSVYKSRFNRMIDSTASCHMCKGGKGGSIRE